MEKFKEIAEKYKNLQNQLKMCGTRKEINTLDCKMEDLIDYIDEEIDECFINPETKGNFAFGYKLDYYGNIIPNSSITLFHKNKNSFNKYEYICEISSGRNLPNVHSYKCNLSFLNDKTILVRSFGFKYTENEDDSRISAHFAEQFYLIVENENNNIDIYPLSNSKGKEMWQKTLEYKNKVQEEESNRERNLVRKTKPSALSKKEKQFILSKHIKA